MATIIKTDQTTTEMPDVRFEAIQKAVGGYVALVRVSGQPDKVLAVNEEGELRGLPPNEKATKLAGKPIVGDVVLCDQGDIQ